MNLNAKLRALAALCLVAIIGVAGCKPSQPKSSAAVDAALEVAKGEVPDQRVSVLTHKFGATGPNPAGWKVDPTTGNLVAPSGKVIEGLNYKNALNAALNTNQATLTGLAQTVDGVALSTDGMRVGLFGQTTTTQDACYVVHSGAWTLCTDLPTGASAVGSYFPVSAGTANKGVWIITSGAVVGTNDLVATNLVSAGGGGAVSSVQGLTGAVVLSTDLIGGSIAIKAVTAAALPAYTAANGTLGVGRTLTANANGAFPAVDTVTINVCSGVHTSCDKVLVQNGAAAADNGVYVLTTAGSGGSAWVLTGYTGLDEAAEYAARPTLTVSRLGAVHGGGAYTYKIRDSITMGTTALYARRTDAFANWRESEGFGYREDFALAVSPGANLNFPGSGLALQSATLTLIAATIFPAGTATESGLFQAQLSASATSFGGAVESSSATGAQGRAYTLGTKTSFEAYWRATTPTLSTGAAEYAVNLGYVNTSAASQVNPANSIVFIYDRPTNVNWRACCIVASSATCTDTGVPAATTFHTFRIEHAAGGNVFFDIDDAQVASIAYSSCPSAATNMFLMADAYGSVGAVVRNALELDVMSDYVHWPEGRF